MNKTFYKRKQLPKVFFDRHMQVRSYAYGSEVHARFLEWQRDYVNARGGTGEKLIIAAQSSITTKSRENSFFILFTLLIFTSKAFVYAGRTLSFAKQYHKCQQFSIYNANLECLFAYSAVFASYYTVR